MSDVKDIEFTSTVFPSDADITLWNSLSAEERESFIAHAEDSGFRSGVAADETLEARLARVRRDDA